MKCHEYFLVYSYIFLHISPFIKKTISYIKKWPIYLNVPTRQYFLSEMVRNRTSISSKMLFTDKKI